MMVKRKWSWVAFLAVMLAMPAASSAGLTGLGSGASMLQDGQKSLSKLQQKLHAQILRQQRLQLVMNGLRQQQLRLQLKQQKLQARHLQGAIKVRELLRKQTQLRIQLRQLRIKVRAQRARKRAERRARARKAQAAKVVSGATKAAPAARRIAPAAKKPAKAVKKPALGKWLGYMVSRASPVGPKFAMQHPRVSMGQQYYFNVVSPKGKFLYQAILLFKGGTVVPKRDNRLIELTAKSRTISAIKGRRGGYRGTVIRAISWRYTK